jgi:hypothetical protein
VYLLFEAADEDHLVMQAQQLVGVVHLEAGRWWFHRLDHHCLLAEL